MKHSRLAFTLVEIMIVVVIIGLLASMAIPSLRFVRHNANVTRFLNDIRIFKDALETYYLEVGTVPTNSAAGTLAPELEDYIDKAIFEDATSIGGSWDIESNSSGIVLGVGVVGHRLTNDELQKLDAKYDDGDITTGKLRAIAGGSYFWIVD